MCTKMIFILVFLLQVVALKAGEEPKTVSADLKAVTIYRSGAEMTHSTTTKLTQGSSELIIDNVSNQIDMNSVQVTCPKGVTILSVGFAKNYLSLPVINPKIQLLKDSLEKVQDGLGKVNGQIGTVNELQEVLKSNKDIKGSQTGLSVAELMKLMEFYKNKSKELQAELATLSNNRKKLEELAAKINSQILEEESANTKQGGQLVLQLSAAVSGNYDFTLSYITPNAFWTPYYDIRVDDIKSPMKIIYKAKVNQTTGIAWKKVKLSLSTSTPSQWGNAPVLQSWFLSYINPVAVMERRLMSNRIQSMDEVLEGRVTGVAVNGEPGAATDIRLRGIASMKGDNTPLYVVNGAVMSASEFSKINAASIKSVDVLKDASATAIYGSRANNGAVIVTLKNGLEDYVSVTDNELNITFDIDIPYDVPTSGKEQTATLKEYEVGSAFKYYSVPRMDKDAYLLAEVADWEKLNLLPGDANIIFEGTYVGKSFIDPNSTFDTLNLTLGRDKRVVVKKEKLIDYSSVKFLGSNKLQKITYELTVKNNKKDTVRMLLKDQYPLTTNKEIEVELIEDGGAVVNKEIGVLTWKLELKPGEVKKLRFSYSVKYPKDKMLNLN